MNYILVSSYPIECRDISSIRLRNSWAETLRKSAVRREVSSFSYQLNVREFVGMTVDYSYRS
jgi:hypothetical protein